MKFSDAPKIIIFGDCESDYLKKIALDLKSFDMTVDCIVTLTRTAFLVSKIESFIRIKNRCGIFDTLLRVIHKVILPKFRSKASNKNCDTLREDIIAKKYLKTQSFSSLEVANLLSQCKSKIVILAGTGLVSKQFLDLAGQFCINGHPAILPGLRGVDIVEHAILQGKKQGVSCHFVAPQVDSGRVILCREVGYKYGESFSEFSHRLLLEQARIVAEAAMAISRDHIECFEQGELGPICFNVSHRQRLKARKIYEQENLVNPNR